MILKAFFRCVFLVYFMSLFLKKSLVYILRHKIIYIVWLYWIDEIPLAFVRYALFLIIFFGLFLWIF